jgi:fumarate hydratase subunit beta
MSAHQPARKTLVTPLTDDDVLALRCGDQVALSGVVYSARDAAHRLLVEALDRGDDLPFEPVGQVIYYMGPSPAPAGRPVGAAGPTTSSRMDPFAVRLYEAGVKATIGKGERSAAVRAAIARHRALYLAAIGGAGALLARSVRQARVIAYPELGPEALRRLVVEGFPAVVVNDAHGADLYETARQETHA